ncbi:hypothetical protein [Actinoplanes sp. RD1]|uniref:hypothetical protein n=1 Tax=Actinoplanes sp. RD1 TaxID=3064538 RepID=UPI002742995E|nr:hypothetical protein [Actinoplanes sp. RD1]
MLDEWLGDLRSIRHVKRTTIRSYQDAVGSFCQYVTDPAYDWAQQCEARFGSHPIQVVHNWNTAVHAQENEADAAKHAFTLRELHTFFSYCDEQVDQVRSFGRKGWLPAFRDKTCSRPRTPTGCAATKPGCWTRRTSAATRAVRSSASTASAMSGTASQEGLPTETAQRVDRLRLDDRRAR